MCSGILVFMMISCASLVEDYRRRQDQNLDEIINSVSDQKLLGYAENLSSEKYAGRLSGTSEYKKAAEWVASLFKKWQIAPSGEDGTYLQSFPNPYTLVFEGGELAYHYDKANLNKKKYYEYERDYYPGAESGSGAVTAEVVYVGYGIYAPELNYNDYEGVHVKGKIVFIEPGVPVSPEEDPDKFEDWKHYSLDLYKIKMAAAQGAKALLYHELKVDPNTDYVKGFLVSYVGDSVAEDVFAGTGITPEEARQKIQKDLSPHSVETENLFTMENLTEHRPKGTGYNVVGLIKGKDPVLKDEVIIIGAHLDHVGFCYEVMPGADDNASGVAVMLGAAEALAKSSLNLRRSVLLVAFGGKEQGLLGSKAYLENPVFPFKQTVLFVNLDTVGSGKSLKVFGAHDFSDFWKVLRKNNKRKVRMNLVPEYLDSLGEQSSDAESFYKKKIPTLFFREEKNPGYIHTTKDTPDKLNPKIMKDLSHLISYFVTDLAQ